MNKAVSGEYCNVEQLVVQISSGVSGQLLHVVSRLFIVCLCAHVDKLSHKIKRMCHVQFDQVFKYIIIGDTGTGKVRGPPTAVMLPFLKIKL